MLPSLLIRRTRPIGCVLSDLKLRKLATSVPKLGSSPRFDQSGDQDQHQDQSHDERSDRNGRFSWAPKANPSMLAFTLISYRNYNSEGPPSNRKPPPIVEDLQQAVLEGDENRVSYIVRQCTPNDINTRHALGWQPLHVAAANGRHRICEILLKSGAKVNDIDQYSPRALAETTNMDPLVIALIRDTEFNPDLARTNFFGSTALHYAALSNSLETVEVLAKYGANPTIKNTIGFTPAKMASRNMIAEYLTNYEQEYARREIELLEEERRRYPLEQRIKDRIVGQEAAISMVAATIRRKEYGWFDEDHPLVFLFLGSSGIGKTELAKQVAKYLHKDDKLGFIRLDMSEYQEKHSVARMIGSPPGYVGHQDGGQLTDALKKCSNAVVLFDEVEKAHPQVLTILLQLFDEGRLTDGKGQTIECKNAIFIMTSNLASEAIAEHAMQLRSEQQLARELRIETQLKNKTDSNAGQAQEQITISRKFKDEIVRPILKAHLLRDEFLGRINEMVYFLPFSESELRQLVTKELEFWASKAKSKNSMELTWDDKVINVIMKGYDIHYGARSIKHEVERRIINQISELHHSVKKAKKVHISVNDKNDDGTDLINIKIS